MSVAMNQQLRDITLIIVYKIVLVEKRSQYVGGSHEDDDAWTRDDEYKTQHD